MAEPDGVRIRELRLRLPRRALDGSARSELAAAVRRGLPPGLAPRVAAQVADEVARAAQRPGGRA